jgi:pimeloyl-ACP methyl ester carboxylesterase
VKRLPIVYIRGYAGPTTGIDAQVDDPFYGFNRGATHMRVGGSGEPAFYQFEGPMLRLMIDHHYQLLVQGDQHAYLQNSDDRSVDPGSIWVYRFYDQAATTFDDPPRRPFFERIFTDIGQHFTADGFNIESAAAGLYDLIKLIQRKIKSDDKRVVLVAHSMGGLIARCMMQKVAVEKNEPARNLVAKLFTYGTPHGGIVFQTGLANWFEDVIGPAGADIFAPEKMYGYLTKDHKFGDLAPKDWDPQSIPPDVFDTNDVFCLIGTDSKDYGVSKVPVGPKSDGLVRIEHAYVRNANRAFVFKSHSGSYGEVNSEEGYQNLQRFLFGRWQVRVDLAGLPTYAKLEEAQPPAVWQADMRLSVRGLSVVLSEQRADQYTPIQLNAELQQRKDSPDHPVPLLTTFLFDQTTASGSTPTPDGQDPVRHQGRVRYSLTLRVAKLTQHDHSFDFSEHLEQVPDWADTAIFDVGPNATGDGLAAWAAWNSDVEGANDQKDPITPDSSQLTHTDGHWQFKLPLPAAARALPILGDNATLLVTVTDRDQPAAQDRGAELAQAGVRGQGG